VLIGPSAGVGGSRRSRHSRDSARVVQERPRVSESGEEDGGEDEHHRGGGGGAEVAQQSTTHSNAPVNMSVWSHRVLVRKLPSGQCA